MVSFNSLILVLHFIFLYFQFAKMASPKLDQDKTTAEYLLSHGYAVQTHKVITEDGYILTLWRIPRNLSYTGPRGPPVLLHHGIMDTGFSFLFQSIEKNLPIMLVDHGNFDVWIANSRGNIESLEHVTKNSQDYSGDYWDFSWDEMATYDLPAVIKYISAETEHEKIKYVCHSQGCTILLALSCMNLDFINKHIEQVVMLAPALYFIHQKSWILRFLLEKFEVLGIFDFLHLKNGFAMPSMSWLSKFLGNHFPRLWLAILNLFLGRTNEEHIDINRVPVIASHELGGTSLQNMKHWDQGLDSDKFRKMDFGEKENIKRYGQPTAPEYNITNLKFVQFPSAIYAFENDTLITPEAVKRLSDLLPEGSTKIELVKDANHVSGYWGEITAKGIFPFIELLFQRKVY